LRLPTQELVAVVVVLVAVVVVVVVVVAAVAVAVFVVVCNILSTSYWLSRDPRTDNFHWHKEL
jgi:hypothetical protein